MMLRDASQSNNSSKDAMAFAPYFRSAKNSNSVYVTDIVMAVSVFLYVIISLICGFGILSFCTIGLISLSVIIGGIKFMRKKQTAGLAC